MSRIWLRHARALRWTVATPGAIASESKDGFPGWTEAAFRLPADGGGCGLPRAARCRTPGEKEVAEGVRFCLLLPAILVYRYTGILVKRGVAVFLNKFRGGFLSILNRRRESGRISGRQTWTEGACAAAWPRREICSLSKRKMLRTGNAGLRPREMALPRKRRGGVAP